MKHFKLKITLITLFILITAAVCCAMIFHFPSNKADNYDAIIELLAKRNITAEDGAFDNISSSLMTDAVMENAVSDRESFACAILGSEASALPSASNIFMLNNQNVVFNGNSFHFETSEKRDEYYYPRAAADNAEISVGQIAKKLGLDISDSIIESSEDNGSVTYKITKRIDDAAVFNDVFTIVITDGYISLLDGIWFSVGEGGTRAEVNINNALIKFMNMPDIPKPAHIVSLETGYRLEDDTKQSSPAQPACQITLDDGTVYYVEL